MHILADGGDTTIKVVIGLGVLVFWLISQATAALSKKPDKYRGPAPADLPPRPLETQPRQHPDLPGPRRGIATKMGLPNPAKTKSPRPGKNPQRPPVGPQRQLPLPRPIATRTAPPALPRQVKRQDPRPAPARVPHTNASAAPVAHSEAGRRTSAEIGAPLAVRPPKTANALPRSQFVQALLKQRNLRKAYILSEILQPPLALRE